jgi:hypothetical protein
MIRFFVIAKGPWQSMEAIRSFLEAFCEEEMDTGRGPGNYGHKIASR